MWSPREPEQLRPGKCMKHRVHLGQCPCRAPWSLSSVNRGRTRCLGLGQTQCGPYNLSTSHTCQQYLFAVFLLPHNTTDQVIHFYCYHFLIFLIKFFIIPLIFIFITYYYLAKKDHIFKTSSIYNIYIHIIIYLYNFVIILCVLFF